MLRRKIWQGESEGRKREKGSEPRKEKEGDGVLLRWFFIISSPFLAIAVEIVEPMVAVCLVLCVY
jgi:hypothetical protein